MDQRVAGGKRAAEFLGLFVWRHRDEPHRVAGDSAGAMLEDAGGVAGLKIVDWTVVECRSIEGDPDRQRIGGRLAEIGVVLVRWNARADAGGLVERLNAHQHGLTVHENADEVENFGASREIAEERIVLFHPPEVADGFAVRFEGSIAGGKRWGDLGDVTIE